MNLNEKILGTYGTLFYVHNMSKSIQYYREVLNLQVEEESPEWTTFKFANGHRVCLHATEDTSKVTGTSVLVLSVRNLEDVVATLKQRGAEIVADIHEVCPNGYSADVRDPNGVPLSFFEYKG